MIFACFSTRKKKRHKEKKKSKGLKKIQLGQKHVREELSPHDATPTVASAFCL